MVWLLSVLYYKGVFIASISDAVSSHPVSPRLCTHTETEKKSKEGKEGAGGLGDGGRGWGRLLSKGEKKTVPRAGKKRKREKGK